MHRLIDVEPPFFQILDQLRLGTPGDEGGPGHVLNLLVGTEKGSVADPVQELQHCQEGVVFQGAPEHPELNGGIGQQVDTGITFPVTLGVEQNVLGMFLQAIPGGPLGQLAAGAAGEFQHLLPVLLKEIENPGDDLILFLQGISKGGAVDVDMEAAGARLMGTVAQTSGLVQNFFPGHVTAVVVQGHGMADDLEALVQGAVMLAVGPFLSVVDQLENLTGVAVVFSGTVNLQFYSKVPVALTEELRFRLVVIVVDFPGAGVVAMASVAPGFIVIIVVGIILKDDPAAVFTGGVVAIKAGLAQVGIFVAGVAVGPDALTAPLAAGGFRVQAGTAQQRTIKLRQGFRRMQAAAGAAGNKIFQGDYLQNKDSPEQQAPGFREIICG